MFKSASRLPSEEKATSLKRVFVWAFTATVALTLVCACVGVIAFQLISAEFETLREERLTEVGCVANVVEIPVRHLRVGLV